MSRENNFRFPAQVGWSLRNIRTRTWLILGAVGVAIFGLMAWAGIAILFWLWGQAPSVSEAGKRLAGEAVTQIEQVAPGLKEQVGQWLPGLGEAAPVSDVSGTDVGPVPRYPGLVRSHFTREGQAVEVRYAGRAEFDMVLAHYVKGFAAATYAQEVLSATSEGEQHRFQRGQESIDLSLRRSQGGLLELRLKLSSQQS